MKKIAFLSIIFCLSIEIAYARQESLITSVGLPGLKINGTLYSPEDIVLSMQFNLSWKQIEEKAVKVDRTSNVDEKNKINMKFEQKRLAFVIYKDAIAVWSDNFIQGGPPFHLGKVDMKAVEKVLEQFKNQEFFEKYKYTYSYATILPIDSGIHHQYHATLYAKSGDDFLYMQNAWELLEQNPAYVGLRDVGVYLLKPTETKAEVLDKEPQGYLQERQDWVKIKNLMISLFKDNTEIIDGGEIQVQYMYLIDAKYGMKDFEEGAYPKKPIWEKQKEEIVKDFVEHRTKTLNPSTPEEAAILKKTIENLKQNALKLIPQEQREAYIQYFDKMIEQMKKGEEPGPFIPDAQNTKEIAQ